MSNIKHKCTLSLAEYEHPLKLQMLSSFLPLFSSQFPHLHLSPSVLGQMCFEIQNFMEINFGRFSSKPYVITKLPSSFFQSFESEGPLFFILDMSLKFQDKMNWNSFDLGKSDCYDEICEFFRGMENMLMEKNFIVRKRFLLSKLPQDIKEQMKAIVISKNCEVVEDISLASHVIEHQEVVKSENQDNEEYVRTLDMRSDNNGEILVHWWYYPDSYNEWLPSDDIDGIDPADDRVRLERQWHVSSRFITDCSIFNEWGNELDYEIEAVTEDEQDGGDAHSSQITPSRNSKSKKSKARKRIDTKVESIPESFAASEKAASQCQPPSLSGISGTRIVEISNDEAPKLVVQEGSESSSNGTKRKYPDSDVEPGEAKRSKVSSRALSSTSSSTSISASGGSSSSLSTSTKLPEWFSIEDISPVEMRYLSDILHLTQLPKFEYLRIRNYMISLYQHSPSQYFSATDCRRKIGGDVCLLIRIHEFLDAFGVINHSVKAECRPIYSPGFLASSFEEGFISSSASNHLPSVTSDPSNWNPQWDDALLEAALKFDGNWDEVSLALKDYGVSSEDCKYRFAICPLLLPSNLQSVVSNDSSALSSTSSRHSCMSLSTNQIEKQLSNYSLDFRKAILKLISVHNNEVDTKNENMDASSGPVRDMLNVVASTVACRDSFCAEKSAVENTLEGMIQDYMTTRIEMFEDKLKLLSQIEDCLEIEREYLDIERRNVFLQRAQLSILNQSNISSATTNAGSGMISR